jgi:hypothetical protein
LSRCDSWTLIHSPCPDLTGLWLGRGEALDHDAGEVDLVCERFVPKDQLVSNVDGGVMAGRN